MISKTTTKTRTSIIFNAVAIILLLVTFCNAKTLRNGNNLNNLSQTENDKTQAENVLRKDFYTAEEEFNCTDFGFILKTEADNDNKRDLENSREENQNGNINSLNILEVNVHNEDTDHSRKRRGILEFLIRDIPSLIPSPSQFLDMFIPSEENSRTISKEINESENQSYEDSESNEIGPTELHKMESENEIDRADEYFSRRQRETEIGGNNYFKSSKNIVSSLHSAFNILRDGITTEIKDLIHADSKSSDEKATPDRNGRDTDGQQGSKFESAENVFKGANILSSIHSAMRAIREGISTELNDVKKSLSERGHQIDDGASLVDNQPEFEGESSLRQTKTSDENNRTSFQNKKLIDSALTIVPQSLSTVSKIFHPQNLNLEYNLRSNTDNESKNEASNDEADKSDYFVRNLNENNLVSNLHKEQTLHDDVISLETFKRRVRGSEENDELKSELEDFESQEISKNNGLSSIFSPSNNKPINVNQRINTFTGTLFQSPLNFFKNGINSPDPIDKAQSDNIQLPFLSNLPSTVQNMFTEIKNTIPSRQKQAETKNITSSEKRAEVRKKVKDSFLSFSRAGLQFLPWYSSFDNGNDPEVTLTDLNRPERESAKQHLNDNDANRSNNIDSLMGCNDSKNLFEYSTSSESESDSDVSSLKLSDLRHKKLIFKIDSQNDNDAVNYDKIKVKSSRNTDDDNLARTISRPSFSNVLETLMNKPGYFQSEELQQKLSASSKENQSDNLNSLEKDLLNQVIEYNRKQLIKNMMSQLSGSSDDILTSSLKFSTDELERANPLPTIETESQNSTTYRKGRGIFKNIFGDFNDLYPIFMGMPDYSSSREPRETTLFPIIRFPNRPQSKKSPPVKITFGNFKPETSEDYSWTTEESETDDLSDNLIDSTELSKNNDLNEAIEAEQTPPLFKETLVDNTMNKNPFLQKSQFEQLLADSESNEVERNERELLKTIDKEISKEILQIFQKDLTASLNKDNNNVAIPKKYYWNTEEVKSSDNESEDYNMYDIYKLQVSKEYSNEKNKDIIMYDENSTVESEQNSEIEFTLVNKNQHQFFNTENETVLLKKENDMQEFDNEYIENKITNNIMLHDEIITSSLLNESSNELLDYQTSNLYLPNDKNDEIDNESNNAKLNFQHFENDESSTSELINRVKEIGLTSLVSREYAAEEMQTYTENTNYDSEPLVTLLKNEIENMVKSGSNSNKFLQKLSILRALVAEIENYDSYETQEISDLELKNANVGEFKNHFSTKESDNFSELNNNSKENIYLLETNGDIPKLTSPDSDPFLNKETEEQSKETTLNNNKVFRNKQDVTGSFGNPDGNVNINSKESHSDGSDQLYQSFEENLEEESYFDEFAGLSINEIHALLEVLLLMQNSEEHQISDDLEKFIVELQNYLDIFYQNTSGEDKIPHADEDFSREIKRTDKRNSEEINTKQELIQHYRDLSNLPSSDQNLNHKPLDFDKSLSSTLNVEQNEYLSEPLPIYKRYLWNANLENDHQMNPKTVGNRIKPAKSSANRRIRKARQRRGTSKREGNIVYKLTNNLSKSKESHNKINSNVFTDYLQEKDSKQGGVDTNLIGHRRQKRGLLSSIINDLPQLFFQPSMQFPNPLQKTELANSGVRQGRSDSKSEIVSKLKTASGKSARPKNPERTSRQIPSFLSQIFSSRPRSESESPYQHVMRINSDDYPREIPPLLKQLIKLFMEGYEMIRGMTSVFSANVAG